MVETESIIKINGNSDDIVSVDGSLTKELYPAYKQETYLITNTGSIIRPKYTKEGIWKFDIIQEGVADYITRKSHKDPSFDHDYSELLIIKSDLEITAIQHLNGELEEV